MIDDILYHHYVQLRSQACHHDWSTVYTIIRNTSMDSITDGAIMYDRRIVDHAIRKSLVIMRCYNHDKAIKSTGLCNLQTAIYMP